MNLDLTPAQADALTTVLYNVGGDPMGPRRLTDDILSQLLDAGAVNQDNLIDWSMPNRVTFVGPDGEGTPEAVRVVIAHAQSEIQTNLSKEN